MDAQLAVQTGIYSALTGDAPLMALVTGIYDIVPEKQVFPFITIGEMTQVDDSTASVSGMDLTLMIHIWDQDLSRYKLKEIAGEIYRVLHNQNWAIAGMNLVNCRFEFSDVLGDPDGRTQHCLQRFRIITDQV